MTYLDLVNNVLRRLREEEVATISATTYSKMVGDFVNDAKRLVETAWSWSALRTTITVNTEADVFSYALTGTETDFTAVTAMNDTSNVFLEYRSSPWFADAYLNKTPSSGSPTYYTYNGVDTNGDTLVEVYPKPDGVYTLRFDVILRNNDLSADTDKLYIPHMPVMHLAVALLARERGETGGTSAPEYFAIADKYLSDAIALDATKHPDETTWYTA